ncbi:MAG: glycosyltransferase [Chitinophagaceae bacterium]|nr:glycosyltransferase [Chitinophagaceae bacterium]
MKTLYFTVTNDLNYDQRMIRICSSLTGAGYRVVLVGRETRASPALNNQVFQQKRILCRFKKGKLHYAEYNFRLFFYLLFKKMDAVCAIDLDTILPCLFISKLKAITRIYDAHELFCEMKEVVTRPGIYKVWKRVEKFAVPRFKWGYTVNSQIAHEFKKMYGVQYEVIRNLPVSRAIEAPEQKERIILYQGAVNEGRSFETLIPAMKEVNSQLIIYGDGNYFEQVKEQITKHNLQDKVILKGKLPPEQLWQETRKAMIGVTLFENNGLNNYYSLANRFFDYIQAAVPQLCVDYPAYREVNEQFNIACLISDLSPANIAHNLNNLLDDVVLYNELRENCLKARKVLNWQMEEEKLIEFYKKVSG